MPISSPYRFDAYGNFRYADGRAVNWSSLNPHQRAAVQQAETHVAKQRLNSEAMGRYIDGMLQDAAGQRRYC